MKSELIDRIFNHSPQHFEELSLEVFRYQALNNEVYAKYISLLDLDINQIHSIDKIPFIPISFFKTHRVITGEQESQVVFSSSGTTGMVPSKHYVFDAQVYERSFLEGFRLFYGDVSNYVVLALLPSYLEREGSSLIYMVDRLIADSGRDESGFYLHNQESLVQQLQQLEAAGQPTLLIGVTFALLELAAKYSLRLKNTIVMETGGMKGRGKEPVRSEVHHALMKSFGLTEIHSEYGMTELLSQAYSKGNGVFQPPPWMKILVHDPYDPFGYLPAERSGALNIIDLANIHSCSFIQTDDLGLVHPDGTFEVQGRMDGSPIRGCSLLVL